MMRCLTILALLVLPLMGGCVQSVQVDNPSRIDAEAYDAAFTASAEVLRDHGLRIARNDYRFGILTAYPKESSTLLEPWVGDNTTRDQARSATLNAERRIVSVSFVPADNAAAYHLTVAVRIERLRQPDRYLTHSASGFISARYSAVPTHLHDKGIEGDYWEPVGQDAELEQRLLAAVLDRLDSAEE